MVRHYALNYGFHSRCLPRPKLSVASVYWTYTDSVHWGTLMEHCQTLTGSTTVYAVYTSSVCPVYTLGLLQYKWPYMHHLRSSKVVRCSQ